MHTLRLICFLFNTLFAAAFAASNIEWATSYNGAGNDPDRIAAIAPDSSGIIYVLGSSTVAGTREDLLVLKYSPAGDTLWSRTIDYPTAHHETAVALTLSTGGDIVATGTTYSESDRSDILTARLSSAGDLLWIRKFASPVHADDEPVAVICDNVGNVYVTGTTATQVEYPALENYITIKYNDAGNEQWVRQYRAGETNLAKDIAIDSSLNVYVTGSCVTLPGSPGPHATTIKYLPDGTVSWIRTVSDTTQNAYTAGLEVEIDAEQNLYIASSLIHDSDIHTILTKYNSAGDSLWQLVYLGEQPRWETNTGLALMPAGGAILVSSSSDISTARYSADGNLIWSRRWSVGLPVYRQSYECAVSSSGNVFVSGFLGSSSTYHQIVTLGYSAFGDSLFASIDSIDGYYRGEGIDVAVSDDGSVYTGCRIATSSVEDIGLLKYSPSGLLYWKKTYSGRGSANDYAASLVTDLSNNAYVVGYSCENSCDAVIAKYSPDGSELWRWVFDGAFHGDDRAAAAAIDLTGDLVVVGSVQTAESSFGDALRDFWVAKFTSFGDTIWTRTIDGGGSYPFDNAKDVAIDSIGDIYVTGDSYGTEEDFLTVKFDQTGNMIWSRRYNGPGNGEDHAEAIIVGPSGDVFVTGSSDGGMENDDILTVKYSNDGIQQWVNRYDVPPGGDEDSGEDIAIGPDSLPCVAGFGSDALVVLKYTDGGDTLWSQVVRGPMEASAGGRCIDVDQSGNIFVGGAVRTGTSSCSYDASEAIVIKYGADGHFIWQWNMDNSENCSDRLTKLRADHLGGVFAVGRSGYPSSSQWDDFSRILAVRIQSTGMTRWSAEYEGTESGYATAIDLAIDSQGKPLVIGQTVGIASGSDITVLKLSQSSLCGDADGSGVVTISDAVYLISHIFGGGPAPDPLLSGDANCSGGVSISDAVYLISYIFLGGAAPCAACP